MLKRTKGCLLLTLLVITGLAGTLHSGSISQRERKYAATELRDTKDLLIQLTSTLSEKQLNYKSSPSSWSIKQIIYHLALSEDQLWKQLRDAIKAPSDRQAFSATNATAKQEVFEGNCNQLSSDHGLSPAKGEWKNTVEALAAFRSSRNDHIRYIRTSTESLREHGLGSMDCYDMIIAISSHCQEHISQIQEIRSTFGFPTH